MKPMFSNSVRACESEEKTETEALFACPDAECSLSKMECPSCGGTSHLNIEASGLQHTGMCVPR